MGGTLVHELVSDSIGTESARRLSDIDPNYDAVVVRHCHFDHSNKVTRKEQDGGTTCPSMRW